MRVAEREREMWMKAGGDNALKNSERTKIMFRKGVKRVGKG